MAKSIKFGFLRRSVPTLALLFFGFSSGATHAQTPNVKASKAQMSNEKTLDNLLDAPRQTPFRWFASTDAKRRNEDYLRLKPNETRRIPLTGGNLLRLWFTSSNPEKNDVILQNGTQKIALLRGGKASFGELWNKAWLFYPNEKTGANSPISSTRFPAKLAANAVLLVTNRDSSEMKFFYQATVRAQTSTAVLRAGKTSQFVSEWTLQPGKSRDFAVNAPAGIIEEISVLVGSAGERGESAQNLPEVWRDLKLRARWDDETTDSVDASLAQLAGGKDGVSPPNNAISIYKAEKLTLKWPMPSTKKRKLTLFNAGKTPLGLYLLTTLRQIPDAQIPPYRFHARFGSAQTESGKPVAILRVKGEGAFAGLNLGMRPAPNSVRRTFAYLEGNEILTADGIAHEGTGNEDFFSSAWYFPDKPFARDFHGLTAKSSTPPTVSAYRLMIPDAVPFKQNFSFDFGHGARNGSDDMEFHWVAFWYQKTGGSFEIDEKISPNSASANAGENANGNENTGESSSRTPILLGVLAVLGGALALFALSKRRKS